MAQAPVPPLIAPPASPLTDGHIALRLFREDDAPALVEAARDPDIPRLTALPELESEAWAREWIALVERRWRDGSRATFATADARTDELLGSIGVRDVDGNGQIGYWVLPAARGRGVATRALRLISLWALRDLDLRRAQLHADVENVASQRVAERAGYTREGVLRAWLEVGGESRDHVLYSLLATDLDR